MSWAPCLLLCNIRLAVKHKWWMFMNSCDPARTTWCRLWRGGLGGGEGDHHHHHHVHHHHHHDHHLQVLTYHCVLTSAQRLLNPEGGMARRGAEPVSRKVSFLHPWWWWWWSWLYWWEGTSLAYQVRTPGRNRAGYVVYLAYQVSTVSSSSNMESCWQIYPFWFPERADT